MQGFVDEGVQPVPFPLPRVDLDDALVFPCQTDRLFPGELPLPDVDFPRDAPFPGSYSPSSHDFLALET